MLSRSSTCTPATTCVISTHVPMGGGGERTERGEERGERGEGRAEALLSGRRSSSSSAASSLRSAPDGTRQVPPDDPSPPLPRTASSQTPQSEEDGPKRVYLSPVFGNDAQTGEDFVEAVGELDEGSHCDAMGRGGGEEEGSGQKVGHQHHRLVERDEPGVQVQEKFRKREK